MKDAVRETRAQAIITLTLGQLFDECQGRAHVTRLWQVCQYDMGLDTFERIMGQLVEAEIVQCDDDGWIEPLDITLCKEDANHETHQATDRD